jgi:hypothetical protein
MFKLVKFVLTLVVLTLAGAFVYDKYCSMGGCDCDEDGKCC